MVVPFYIASSSVGMFYMGEVSLIREQDEDESMCDAQGTSNSPSWANWVVVDYKEEILFQASSCRALLFGVIETHWKLLRRGLPALPLALNVASHLHTILSLMLLPPQKTFIYYLGTILVPSMERPRPTWNVNLSSSSSLTSELL